MQTLLNCVGVSISIDIQLEILENISIYQHTHVTSHLDYCNSLSYGAKQSHIDRLQCCQNNAATSVSKRRKFDHIYPVLKKSHWFPVEYMISYKIIFHIYKALNIHATSYLAALISKYVPPRPLRSEEQCLFNSPRWRLETFAQRSFARAAPTLWNPLTPQREASSIY